MSGLPEHLQDLGVREGSTHSLNLWELFLSLPLDLRCVVIGSADEAGAGIHDAMEALITLELNGEAAGAGDEPVQIHRDGPTLTITVPDFAEVAP